MNSGGSFNLAELRSNFFTTLEKIPMIRLLSLGKRIIGGFMDLERKRTATFCPTKHSLALEEQKKCCAHQ
jgi:hypothetical protein